MTSATKEFHASSKLEKQSLKQRLFQVIVVGRA